MTCIRLGVAGLQDLRLMGEWEEHGNYHTSGVENLLEKSCFGDLRPRGIG